MSELTVYEKHYNNTEAAYMTSESHSDWELNCLRAMMTAADYLRMEQKANLEDAWNE